MGGIEFVATDTAEVPGRVSVSVILPGQRRQSVTQPTAQLQPWKMPRRTSAWAAECKLPPGLSLQQPSRGLLPVGAGAARVRTSGFPRAARGRVPSARRPCGPGSLACIPRYDLARNQAGNTRVSPDFAGNSRVQARRLLAVRGGDRISELPWFYRTRPSQEPQHGLEGAAEHPEAVPLP